ncbi:MAG: glycosyltransferase [Parcubacteria group bacterium Licking1014_1]|nr:MAG: glycosyltransferase [Parcubacteria group bacterium Licking1014_1]
MKEIKAIYITFNGLADPLGQSQVLPYLQGLNSAGIKFYLVSLEKNIKEAEKLSEKLENLGISWYKLKYFRFYTLGMAFNVLQCFLLVFYLIVSKKIKIIHSRAYLPIFSVFFLKKIFGLKLIFDMRGFWPEELVDSKRIKDDSIYHKALKFLERKSILSSDYIVTLTPESKEIIESKYREKKLKVVWMPTCVNEEKFTPLKAEPLTGFDNKFIIVYAGSLWSFYDMPSQIDFFNILKTKIPNAHFLILGNNKPEELREIFKQKGVKEDDYTIISLKSEDVPKYLLGSNLGISFRYDFYSQKAAFPTKLAEYLISGLPVVINSNSDYIEKFVRSNKVGVVVNTFNKDSLATAADELLILIKDKDFKQRCIKTAQDYLGKHVCVDKYLDIYNELQKL